MDSLIKKKKKNILSICISNLWRKSGRAKLRLIRTESRERGFLHEAQANSHTAHLLQCSPFSAANSILRSFQSYHSLNSPPLPSFFFFFFREISAETKKLLGSSRPFLGTGSRVLSRDRCLSRFSLKGPASRYFKLSTCLTLALRHNTGSEMPRLVSPEWDVYLSHYEIEATP